MKTATASFSMTLFVAAIALGGCNGGDQAPAEPVIGADRPNILLIVADDMGYTDLGAFGSEIRTPTLDRLALGGVRLGNYHVHPSCAPTRAALLSGALPHEVGIGTQLVTIGRYDNDPIVNSRRGKTGYEGYLTDRAAPMPALLQDAGYRTYMAGKWHVGPTPESSPPARGFDRSFDLVFGSAIHFNNMPAGTYREDGKTVDDLPNDFYSTQAYTDKIITYIDDSKDGGAPWFAYLAYTAPHWPLQVPDDWLDRYSGAYDAGYDALRQQRIAGALERGVISEQAAKNPGPTFTRAWAELSDADKRIYARTMEIYASMVENLDHHVERVIRYLEESGQLDNTVVIFMSDNGAEAFDFDFAETAPRRPENVNNDVDNFGRVDSFIVYGPGWAQASTAPYWRHKGTTANGGIRAPAFINFADVARQGEVDQTFLTVRDLTATILDIAGAEHPGDRYQGRDVTPLEGDSFWPLITGDVASMDRADRFFLWEHDGQVGLVRNGWKYAQNFSPHSRNKQPAGWNLYDLMADPGETTDVSDENPELLAEFQAEWRRILDSGAIIPYPD